MDLIYHEKQEAYLCAQHCLNALLQDPYFTAVDLATIAHELDESERQRMAEGDLNSPEYLQFLQQPSGNMDDSGFFSIQVISKALRVWGLDLIPFSNSSMGVARLHPEKEESFICNFKEHWLTIRKIGLQWFNLNSLLEGPELLSETYLGMFLTQLQGEGYSIFVVRGSLPVCSAHEVLRCTPVVQLRRPRLLSDLKNQQVRGQGSSKERKFSEEDLQKAIARSQEMGPLTEDDDVQEAIRLSIQIAESAKDQPGPSAPVNQEELRRKRQEYFEKQSRSPVASANDSGCRPDVVTRADAFPPDAVTRANVSAQDEKAINDALLAEAIKLSMEISR